MLTSDPQVYKNRIITAFYNSGVVQVKVEGMCFRNRIKKDTLIHEDIIQETFYWICRRPAEEIIEMFESNPNRLIGLAVRIAALKGFVKNSKNPDYYKHSLARYILFASNFQQREHLEPCGEKIEENPFILELVDPDTDKDFNSIWDFIEPNITEEELNIISDYHLPKKLKPKQINPELNDKYQEIVNKISGLLNIDNNG